MHLWLDACPSSSRVQYFLALSYTESLILYEHYPLCVDRRLKGLSHMHSKGPSAIGRKKKYVRRNHPLPP